jgi:DNA-binding NarL/FixJ family response regulator
MEPVRVSVYEDNDTLRDFIELLVNETEGFLIVGTHSNCEQAEIDILHERPHVVIMDINMPGRDGIHGVQSIKAHDISIKVLMHTVLDDDDKLFTSLSNGADGYLLKKDSSLHLITAIQEVIEGGAPMSPGIARKVLSVFQQPIRTPKEKYNISERETQILELLAKGLSYRMIGIECAISPETVKRHLKNIYSKLHVRCGPEAVAKAIRERII